MPKTEAPYQESEHHLPTPTDQTGTLDTSGTAGAADSKLEEVTAVFDEAKKQDLAVAARALDPRDTEVHEALVTLPTGAHVVHQDPDAAAKRVKEKARAHADDDSGPHRRSPAQRQAAEEGAQGKQRAEAQQSEQGAGAR